MDLSTINIDLNGAEPVYRQIAVEFRRSILDGRLPAGSRLPATRDLAQTLGVNRNTVVAAYEALAHEGWVESHTGRGTFVVERDDAADDEPIAEEWSQDTGFSRTAECGAVGGLQSIYRLAIRKDGTSFVGSYPAADLLPVDDFRASLNAVLEEQGAELLGYGPTAGSPALRETIAADMRAHGADADASRVLVTSGAQQAIELVFRTFIERGETVVVEEPTYTGALSVLNALGARIVGIPVDEHGIRPDRLEVALERHRPRMLYVQPTFHNPTATEMPLERRRQIIELCRRFRCLIVEDDWAAELRYEGDRLPTLHALDPAGVIYLSTFSKKLMPGLRVGWVCAQEASIERLVELKRLQDCGTSPLIQAALDHFLRQGGLEKHLKQALPEYRRRRDAMCAALEKHLPKEAKFVPPTGGMFVWVTLPAGFDGTELAAAARQRGVLYSRGDLFHGDGSGHNSLRLTFCAVNVEDIERGVAVLGELIRERRSRGDASGSIESMPIF